MSSANYVIKLLYHKTYTVFIKLARFYPRGASDARVLDIIACVCVCLSVCVCVCVTRRYCIKTAKRRITQTTTRDSAETI